MATRKNGILAEAGDHGPHRPAGIQRQEGEILVALGLVPGQWPAPIRRPKIALAYCGGGSKSALALGERGRTARAQPVEPNHLPARLAGCAITSGSGSTLFPMLAIAHP